MKTTLLSFTLLALLFLYSAPFTYSAANHVLISEVQIAGTTPEDEFIELYNPTGAPVVMEGWKLTRKNSSGTEANLVTSLNGTIPALGYFLIGHGTGYDNASVPLDVAYSAPSNALTNNYTVLLYSDNQVTLVDKVGFGTAADFESIAATNPPVNGSINRINDDDTDNNAADFAVQEISSPQNSLITVTPSPSPSPTLTPTPTPSSTPAITPTIMPTSTPSSTPSPTPTLSPTSSPLNSPTPNPSASPVPVGSVAEFSFTNMICRMQMHYLRVGFWRFPFAMMVCEKLQ